VSKFAKHNGGGAAVNLHPRAWLPAQFGDPPPPFPPRKYTRLGVEQLALSRVRVANLTQ